MEGNDNRNFLIFLAIVFITTVVALIVVLAITWKWIAGPIGYFFNAIGRFQELQTLNYVFPIPEKDVVAEEPPEEETEDEEEIPAPTYDYIFDIPTRSFDRNSYRNKGGLLQDAKSLGYFSQTNDLSEVLYNVQIPKIGFSSGALSGLGEEDLLEKGLWIHPESGDEELGEIVALCYSKYFFPSDKRSCEYLDLLELQDSIYITNDENETFVYKIYDIDFVPVGSEQIYLINNPEEEENILPGLRIISSRIGSNDSERIVVYAELDSELDV